MYRLLPFPTLFASLHSPIPMLGMWIIPHQCFCNFSRIIDVNSRNITVLPRVRVAPNSRSISFLRVCTTYSSAMRHDGILHGSLRADEGRDIVRESYVRADAPWAIGSRFFHCSHRCTLYHPNLANVGSRVLSWLGILCLQGSAESDAAIGAVQTNASWLRHLHLPANFLPSSRSLYSQ